MVPRETKTGIPDWAISFRKGNINATSILKDY